MKKEDVIKLVEGLKQPLFATYDDLEKVQEYVENLGKAEKVAAYVVMGITLNTVVKGLTKEINNL